MFENRSLKLDLIALALCGFVIFLGCALGTYDPADPVPELIRPLNQFYHADPLVYPPNDEPTNACGKWGALAADMLFNSVGIAAYYLVFSLVVVDVLLLTRRQIDSPVMRTAGWVISIIGLTSITALVVPGFSLGPIVGPGGYLGALGQTLLESHFAFAGSLILAASLLLGGLMLCTDYALLRMAWGTASVTATGVNKGRARLAERRAERRKQDVQTVAAEFEEEEFE
ncbi:MAG: DNA translocase FtsK, partial [Planctomycetaceae bacterium]|nr:DNA translocase FtsK [Planctomycetaceae bacterium]